MLQSFRPGKVWLDTEGKRIQAHGGSILYVNGTYFWYGENKEGITGTAMGTKCLSWHNGVRLYSSQDLYNWKDEGLIMYNDTDKSHPFYPTNIMDRPHILFNKATKKYVMWAKCSRVADFGECFFAVAQSDSIYGPFTLVKCNDCTPYHSGDFDLFEQNEKAYVIYENPHTEMICQTLSDDYTSLTDEVSIHLRRKGPPYTREAPAFFSRNGRNFILTSGTTGYYPNATQIDELPQNPHEEWKTLGNACVNDVQNNSFHAQFSSVFKHPHIPDLYIALGDRWLNDLPMDLPDMNDIFERLFDHTKEPLPPNFKFSTLSDENTSEANYVWLPIQFHEDGTPYIVWKSEWTIENFKNDYSREKYGKDKRVYRKSVEGR